MTIERSHRRSGGKACLAAIAIVALSAVAVPAGAQSPPNKCDSAKLGCMRKKALCLVKAHEKAIKKGELPDAAKLAKCHASFDDPAKGCIAKVEGKQKTEKPETICTVTGNTAGMEAVVDAFVAAALAEIFSAPVPTPTSTPLPTFAGMVTDPTAPTMPGPGVGLPWSFGAHFGAAAGHAMCVAIGASHVCTFEEVLVADAAGELDGIVPAEQTFWVHRTSASVPILGMGGGESFPGPGGRCNDWTYDNEHFADGEFGQFQPTQTTPANAQRIGQIDFYTDDDTFYDGVSTAHACGGVADAVAGAPGCAGHCGTALPKAILCCNP